jgi:hypothetical protein
MIQAQVFFHQSGMETIDLPAVPRSGDFISNSLGNVHRVASVLWQHAGVKVFAVSVARNRADELLTDWEKWGRKNEGVTPNVQ